MQRQPHRLRAFTLIEVLIVVAILAVLTSLLLAGLGRVMGNAQRAVAHSMITRIETALSNYFSDQGHYPRLAPRPLGSALGDADAYRDDCLALWIGLMNKPTREAGGGLNAPYLDTWKREHVGYYGGGPAGLNGGLPSSPDGSNQTEFISGPDFLQIGLQPFQVAHMPGAPQQLVFLDPWGSPFHYREWASIRDSAKDAAGSVTRSLAGISLALERSSEGQPVASAHDRPHNGSLYAIWSNGPNGINEFGHPESDDLTNWRR